MVCHCHLQSGYMPQKWCKQRQLSWVLCRPLASSLGRLCNRTTQARVFSRHVLLKGVAGQSCKPTWKQNGGHNSDNYSCKGMAEHTQIRLVHGCFYVRRELWGIRTSKYRSTTRINSLTDQRPDEDNHTGYPLHDVAEMLGPWTSREVLESWELKRRRIDLVSSCELSNIKALV